MQYVYVTSGNCFDGGSGMHKMLNDAERIRRTAKMLESPMQKSEVSI